MLSACSREPCKRVVVQCQLRLLFLTFNGSLTTRWTRLGGLAWELCAEFDAHCCCSPRPHTVSVVALPSPPSSTNTTSTEDNSAMQGERGWL